MLIGVWLLIASGMQPPPAVKTLMLHLRDGMDEPEARRLEAELARLPGVAEALVIVAECVAYLKVDPHTFDKQRLDSFNIS